MKIDSISILKALLKLVNKLRSRIQNKLTSEMQDREDAKRKQAIAATKAVQAIRENEVKQAQAQDKKITKLANKLTELQNV